MTMLGLGKTILGEEKWGLFLPQVVAQEHS